MEIDVFPPIRWSNPEIFEKFVSENVNIELLDDCNGLISCQNLSWQVFDGGCFPGFGPEFEGYICKQHKFDIWLVDFTDAYRLIWDMKSVIEPGCGRQLGY